MVKCTAFPLIAVDVGNARVKLGRFSSSTSSFPEPCRTLCLACEHLDLERLAGWCAQEAHASASWWISSVNRPTATRLVHWLREERHADAVTLLAADDLPLRVAVERPDMVGVDRLLDAVAVNALRAQGRPAVVIDVGTAITIDLVSTEGVFMGGAILPGTAASARTMHELTNLLPLLDIADPTAPPPVLGTSTASAMRSGLFWGTIGALQELIKRMTEHAAGQPDVFLTGGGAGGTLAKLLGPSVQHVPLLTLAGIALSARHLTNP